MVRQRRPADEKVLKVVRCFSQEGENDSSMFYLNPHYDPFKCHRGSHMATLVCVEASFLRFEHPKSDFMGSGLCQVDRKLGFCLRLWSLHALLYLTCPYTSVRNAFTAVWLSEGDWNVKTIQYFQICTLSDEENGERGGARCWLVSLLFIGDSLREHLTVR